MNYAREVLLIFLCLITVIFTTNIKIIIITKNKKKILSSNKILVDIYRLVKGHYAITFIKFCIFFWFPVKQFLDVWAMELWVCTFLCIFTNVLNVVIAFCKNNKTTRNAARNERWLLDITPNSHLEDQKIPVDVNRVIWGSAGNFSGVYSRRVSFSMISMLITRQCWTWLKTRLTCTELSVE